MHHLVYKVRNIKTKQYAWVGGPKIWSKEGKVYKSLSVLKELIETWRKRHVDYLDCSEIEIVEFRLVENKVKEN